MGDPKIPTESEVAELVSRTGEIARGLAFERDQLRELVKAKDRYIACYKTGRNPSEVLFMKLSKLTELLIRESN